MVELITISGAFTLVMAAVGFVGAALLFNAWRSADRIASAFSQMPNWLSWPWYGKPTYYRIIGAVALGSCVGAWILWVLMVLWPRIYAR